jgi:hypothetical protein
VVTLHLHFILTVIVKYDTITYSYKYGILNACFEFVTGRKRQHGRPRHRWEDNIKMGIKETGCKDVE